RCTAWAKDRGSHDGRCLLMLGPIHPAEGFVPLLRALAEIGSESNGWHIVIAGRETGDWRKMLEAAIRRKGAEDRVLLASASDPGSQRAWLARASALVAPALHVRFPVSIMQAVAAGIPVLATTCVAPVGLKDVIRVCGPTRYDLKIALRALFQLTDDDRAAFGRRAHDVGRAVLDWSVLVDRYVRFYQSLC
ncbi:MAG: glycosyltransferase family 4 protein, partial [Phycisphaerae bacterium]